MTTETILIVDDGQENRDFIAEHILRPEGYKILAARDGKEGLDMALQYRPDLILLDLQMPRMDGIQVLHELDRNNADIPVILMTFHGSEEIAIEVYRLGVKDYVKKPYSVEEMLEAIERSLTETRLRREKEALTERILQANRELHRRLQELNILYNVGKSVTSITDINKLLPRIVEAATQMTGAEEGYIYLAEADKIICRAHKPRNMAGAKAVRAEIKDDVAVHVLRSQKPITLAQDQLGEAAVPNNPHSVAYVPLISHDHVLGVLGISNITPGAPDFTADATALLSALSDYAAIAIENSRNYEALRRDKDQLVGTFERFVPPSIVDQAISNPGEIKLGGSRQEVSVLFADIRGYTAWSENARPEEVVEALNHYLSLAAEVILGWAGTLDKFFGDGLMAIFNAPEPQPDHVHRAADAALALRKAVHAVNERFGYNLSYSIGVNVGEAVVGYIGTDRALNYTAIGDVVNLAKRLQEYAAPGQILVEEAVIQRLGSRAEARPMGEITVKGRKTKARVYDLTDLK